MKTRSIKKTGSGKKFVMTGKKVLVTGGLGMIGSTLAHKLIKLGAQVTIVDALIEHYGGNLFNIKDIYNRIQLNISDIRDREAMKYLVQEQDIIFNLAGQVCHNDSIEDPFKDTDINYIGHLNVLECLRRYNPKAHIFHAGSRLQFGMINDTPVNEEHPQNPRSPYALNKNAAENMYLFYYNVHQIPCTLFRIANPFGPRSQMKHSKYSIVNWFIRQAIEDKVIKVFGDGLQIRDYIYVEDLCDAFIKAAQTETCIGQAFNIGSGTGTSFIEMVKTVVEIVGAGKIESIPWPETYINVETGDYVTDITKIQNYTQWTPSVSFREGIIKTCQFYKLYKNHYWNA